MFILSDLDSMQHRVMASWSKGRRFWSIIESTMKMPLNGLRAFATVYAHGGIRSAARELGIVHSSVSRHLAELELWLGVRLVGDAAGRRGITFTPQGEALGRATLSSFRDIERAITAVQEARSGRSVTVSTTPSFAARWLLPRLPRLEQAHPHLEVSVVVDQKIDNLQTDDIDLAIRMGRGPWPDARCEPLMDEVLYPVMSPALFEASGQPAQPADLLGTRLVHDRDPHASWEAWRQLYGPASMDVTAGPRFSSSDLVLRAAVQGQGVALARHRFAFDDIASGALVRPFKDAAVALGPAYWIALPLHRDVRSGASTVIAWLKEQAAYGDTVI
ncbi:LysR substrate-binding domain-containing protein [Stenotrophomonas maltophilia]|uniref:LysR substrate-binding domain-containing protein n=1 Tax=Stenotrophomonas maltophilia TaxID=40324 RepID=UPI001E4F1090|nr:LysR substrate-binding domain-containing protein [Stenotrophomonas maltophilia]